MTWNEKYTVDPTTGCHVWQRARQRQGYGVVWFNGKTHLAHRVAWRMEHGAWPQDSAVLDHICMNKACVNPDHLRELPNSLNIRRAYPRGDEETERRRAKWRESQARHRGNYSPDYSVAGGE